MVEDPILDLLQANKPEGFRKVVEDLSEVLPEGIAAYAGLPEADVRALAARGYLGTCSVVAGREDCPPDLLSELAVHNHVNVRRAVASNSATPIHTVAMLAADTDKWVRQDIARRDDLSLLPSLWDVLATDKELWVRASVARNPGCPPEILMRFTADEDWDVRTNLWRNPAITDEIKTALALSKSAAPKEMQLLNTLRSSGEVPTDPDNLLSLVTNKQLTPSEIQMLMSFIEDNPAAYDIRPRLALQNAVDDKILVDLARAAGSKEEWHSLWNHCFPQTWPSTRAFLTPDAPDPEVLSLLVGAGHPAGLVHSESPAIEPTVNPAVGLAQLIHMELLIRALWPELVLSKLCNIYADEYEGTFFLRGRNYAGGGEVSDALLAGPYIKDRDWVELEFYLDEDDAVLALSRIGDDLEFYSLDALDEEMCKAIAFADHFVRGVRINKEGRKLILQVASKMKNLDASDMQIRVIIRDSDFPEICFGALPERKQSMLVDYLLAARDHALIRQWRLADVFLACIQLHPQTPSDLVARIVASGATVEIVKLG